ncbi:MAG: cystathionine beta-lyase [Alphaproteobacteria bacterium]|jgi:cysteine-S-conjugate beta-lyase|nr:cystathionine beta-lyase [Alphaproteobacteria bacterium]
MKKDTLLVHSGRHPEDNFGIVNPPVYHASTVTFPTVEKYEAKPANPFDGVQYGRTGTPTTFAFEEAITALYGGHKTIATSSGAAAIAISMTAFLKSGDHALVIDNVYGPTRSRVSDTLLARAGVDVTYFDPAQPIGELLRPETKVVFIESPGSLTFEMIDVAAIAAEAHTVGALVLMDNTWATPLLFKPFDHGVDIVIEAATKYIGGHADVMLGVVTVQTPEHHLAVKGTANAMGNCPGPDDCYLGLRGLRTLSVRLERHQKNALRVAEWLRDQSQVDRVLYPALPDDPGHDLWKRDFSGASGLFGLILNASSQSAVALMLDNMDLFAMGASWGGYESLMIPTDPGKIRTASDWSPTGPCLRLHIGLEDPDDLIADLDKGLARLSSAA